MKFNKKQVSLIIGLSIIVVIGLVFLFINLIQSGSNGLRPMTHACFGVQISSEKIVNLFPNADVEFYRPFHFRYYVTQENKDKVFCLGKDIWYGE